MWGIYWRTWFLGRYIGQDEFGNRYYSRRQKKDTKKEKRWVIYNGLHEPSKVPPLWYGWLHHTTSNPPEKGKIRKNYFWEKPHKPNLTGTPGAHCSLGYRPRHEDYQAWIPSALPHK